MTDHPSDITTYCEAEVRVGSVSSSHGRAFSAYDVLRMTMCRPPLATTLDAHVHALATARPTVR